MKYSDDNSMVSILVCSNRAPASIDRLFTSIEGQEPIGRCELVFIDNGIPEKRAREVRDMLGSFPCPVTYQREDVPGIWAARKTSYENARGEWLLILDDDNTLGEDALASLFRFIDGHPEVGAVCPRIIADWEVEPPGWLHLIGAQFLSFNESGGHGPGIRETVWTPNESATVIPPGGGMAVRREVAASFLGSYDSIPADLRNSLLGSEDHALYKHVKRLGYARAYVPSIYVHHFLHRDRNRIGYLFRLNLRMAYAYGRLMHYGHARTGALAAFKSMAWFMINTFASPGLHPWAIWLKLARITGFAAGLLKNQ